MNLHFVIVGTEDQPLFDYVSISKVDVDLAMNEFIIFAALDQVQELASSSAHLKVVDKHGEWLVSAFLTANNVKFMLLHDAKDEEKIKSFFIDVFEAYTKFTLNPFYEFNDKISCRAFDAEIEQSAKKYLK